MKNLNYLLFIFAIIALFSSCSKNPSEMISGEWVIADLQTTSDIPEDQMEAYNAQIEEMKKSSKIIFKEDGTFEQTILDETTTGKWEISDDGKTLTKTSDSGDKETATIQELSDNKLVVVVEFDDIKNTTTFEKVK